MLLSLLFFWPLYLGWGALAKFFLDKNSKLKIALVEELSFWFLLGILGFTIAEFVLSLIGLRFDIFIFGGIGISLIGWWLNRQRLKKLIQNATYSFKTLGFSLIVFSVICDLAIRSLTKAFHTWDAIAFWLPKMFALWQEQVVNTQALIHFNHPEYPLLLPLLGANAFTLVDYPNDLAAKVVLIGVLAALISLLASFLYHKLGFIRGLFFLLLLFSSFIFREHLAGEYVGTADILVGVYLAAGIIALINKQTLLSFVLLVATGWAKSEGQVIAGTAFILMFISFKQYRLIFPLILSAILGPWFLFTKFSTMESSQYFKFSEIYARPWLEYFVYSIHAFREEFRNLPKWNLLFWFFPVAAIINVRKILKHIPSLIILSIILVQLGMYIVIFTITPEEQASFIAAAISRLTLHIAPGILVITSYWFSRDFAKK